MDTTKLRLTQTGKEDLAFALLLLKDFKCQGKLDVDITRQILTLAELLDVKPEFDKLVAKIPPMRIEPRRG